MEALQYFQAYHGLPRNQSTVYQSMVDEMTFRKPLDYLQGSTTNYFRRNLTAGAIFSYDALPESLKTEVLVRTKVEEDPEVLKERQETVKVIFYQN